MISIIIPSRKEKFLNKTILDVLAKARGEIEVLPVLDGYDTERIDDPRVRYILLPEAKHTQKRHGINQAVQEARGEYVMSLDAHCMMAEGFDVEMVKVHQPNWVQIPRRHRLDAENWSLQKQSDNRPPIDYEYIMYPLKYKPPALHGFKWDARTLARAEIAVDETMMFQGSCWLMTKAWFNEMELMQVEGFTGWGQEAEEITFKTWMSGGKVMTNKNTWYAHLHKGPRYGRGYFMTKQSMRDSNKYSFDFFINNRWHKAIYDFNWVIEKFMPLPDWSPNWKEELSTWSQ